MCVCVCVCSSLVVGIPSVRIFGVYIFSSTQRVAAETSFVNQVHGVNRGYCEVKKEKSGSLKGGLRGGLGGGWR